MIAQFQRTFSQAVERGASRLGNARVLLVLAAFILFAAINFGARAWDTFHPVVPNDGLTVWYAQYARNLLRYPLSETFGLMVNLVGDPAGSPMSGEPLTFYSDHPPGIVWLIATVNRLAVGDAIVAARVMSILAAIGAGGAMLAFIWRHASVLPAACASLVLLTLPLYWEHSIVANFEPATLFFTVTAALSFVGYLKRPSVGRLALTAVLWISGMLCDWPAYLLGGPMAVALAWRRRWGLLLFFAALGIGTMAAVFGQLNLQPGGFSPLGFFRGTRSALQTEPFGGSLYRAFGYVVRGFATWCLLLALPFAAMVWRGGTSGPMRELRFLFLAFLFIGVTNDVIFYSWSGEHSFWSYYLTPAACFGAALTFQWLIETPFGSAAKTFQVLIAALFLVGTVSSAVRTARLIRPHFARPPSVAEMLGERHLADLLDPGSTLVVGPYCGRGQSDGATRWPDDMPSCGIFLGQGQKARYWIDKAALASSGFDPARMTCDKTFIVLKGANVPKMLARLGLTATEVPWFEWFVLRLSELPSSYCEKPALVFDELGRLQSP
ncbi:MAG: glycosyltransferase family 39 protein [Xanthobacteraceae bacterium]|nr:glycosyltransferase family 39 protein [Xanthobacteraceae bacterium]